MRITIAGKSFDQLDVSVKTYRLTAETLGYASVKTVLAWEIYEGTITIVYGKV